MVFLAKKMVSANHINCYGLARLFIMTGKWSSQTIFVTKEMVFANHINCYGLARLFIVTRKWSFQTIILVIVLPNYICGQRNGFSKAYKVLWSGKTIYCDWKMV